MPIDLTITFTDKTNLKIHRSVEVWQKGNTTYSLNVPTTKKITRVELGSTYAVDSNKADNLFEVKK